MIDVQDEILSGEPQYRICDKEGNIILDNITIEQTTTLLQIGTNINKKLFDSIHNHLLFNAMYHKLEGFPKSAYTTPTLTESNPQGHIVTWDYKTSTTSLPASAYEMFSGGRNKTIWINGDSGHYLEIDIILPNPTLITEVGGWATSATPSSINRFKVTITAKLKLDNEYEEIGVASNFIKDKVEINSIKAYQYIKLRFIPNAGDTGVIYNGLYITGIQFSGNSFVETITQDLEEELTEGQIMHVQTSENYSVAENLEYKIRTSKEQSVSLPTDLQAGSRYRLVYNGAEFEHENIMNMT